MHHGKCVSGCMQHTGDAPNWSVLLIARRLVAVSLMGNHSCQAWAALILRCGNANSAEITGLEGAQVSTHPDVIAKLVRHECVVDFLGSDYHREFILLA